LRGGGGQKISLKAAVAKLAAVYPLPEPLRDPLAIMVWENVGYLIDEERRAELFAEFKKRIGLKARQLANAPMPVLTDIAKRGGMHPQKRLGLSPELKSYSQSYKAAIDVLREDGERGAEWLERAYLVFRAHGRALCKRSAPICEPCPLDRACAHRPVTTM
jgi:hypothetical protein